MDLDPLQRRVTDSDVDRIFEAIEFIRQFDQDHGSHEISISVLASLLFVGSRNGAHKQALEEDLDMTRSSSSRNTDILSKWHRLILPSGKRKPGLGLIKKEVDGSDRRRSLLTLTNKGEELITQLKDILYGET
jgi:DNA-binding MarR family transcriptional regulator